MLRTRSLSAPLPAALTAAAVLAGTAALLAGNAARGADRIDGWNIGTAAAQAPMPPHGGPGPVPPDQTIMVSGQGTVEAMPDQAMITVGFQITRPTANDAQDRASRALAAAMQDARSAANALASAAGLTPPRLVRIQEVGGSAPPRAAGIHAPNIAMTATPVAPGTLSVSEQVMAIYRF